MYVCMYVCKTGTVRQRCVHPCRKFVDVLSRNCSTKKNADARFVCDILASFLVLSNFPHFIDFCCVPTTYQCPNGTGDCDVAVSNRVPRVPHGSGAYICRGDLLLHLPRAVYGWYDMI